jgi:hypothetical protein
MQCQDYNIPQFGKNINLTATHPPCQPISLLFWKKEISFYIHAWDSLNSRGNPTRSRKIHDLIEYMMKKDAQRQGVPSQAWGPFPLTEFRNIIQALKQGGGGEGIISKWGVRSLYSTHHANSQPYFCSL